MSLNSPMLSRHSADIVASFGARAGSYDHNAGLQAAIGARLAQFLPVLDRPKVLELGCGTGLFSRHLIERYPDGYFVLTDASPAMLAECRRNVAGTGAQHIEFTVMDASRPGVLGRFDVIATSMTLHWLTEQRASLERVRRLLAPSGVLLYAALGPESFVEWGAVLDALGLPSGIAHLELLPGGLQEERLTPDATALAFLHRMKSVGGLTPREGYRPLSPGALRRAIRAADASGRPITWHIAYGRLAATD
jgi:malonyl-CoA O-methyltransferase